MIEFFSQTKRCWLGNLFALLLSVFSMVALADIFDTTTQYVSHDFNHIETGFPLTAGHQAVECTTCHVNGIFKGTPRHCAGCHSKGKPVIATVMSNKHFPTNDPCEFCHTNLSTFYGTRFNHAKVQFGNCASCHNNHTATGKPANHTNGLRATEACDRCHRTTAWFPNTFNHAGTAVAGMCATQCHNGVSAIGRPNSHSSGLKATNPCDVCHRYSGWYPTFYNHSTIAPGSCFTCHNGNTATGKPNSHSGAKATLPCDSCHRTNAWLPASYNHVSVMPGTCSTCHLAQRPTTHKARGYLGNCDNFHTTANWSFNHAAQQGQHTCNNCHAHHHNSTPCDNCHSVYGWGGG